MSHMSINTTYTEINHQIKQNDREQKQLSNPQFDTDAAIIGKYVKNIIFKLPSLETYSSRPQKQNQDPPPKKRGPL